MYELVCCVYLSILNAIIVIYYILYILPLGDDGLINCLYARLIYVSEHMFAHVWATYFLLELGSLDLLYVSS